MRTFLVVFTIVCTGAALILFLLDRDDDSIQTSLSVSSALSADTAGYTRARGPRPFIFPADHGAHPDFRTEWWYYTGNVQTDEGRRFGYQLTIFRTALTPPMHGPAEPVYASRVSPTAGDPQHADSSRSWSTNQVYMAHLALTDVESGEHHAHERFSRGAAGLAGATAEPYRVWIEDWRIEGLNGADSVRIQADVDGFGLDLVAARAKPIVLQGEDGYDRKGPQPGNASFYYSMTRMATHGTIRLEGSPLPVRGWSWLDREWGTSALSEGQVGWDWFSLQLRNDVEIMYYQIREGDGSASPFSGGIVVEPGGGTTRFTLNDVKLEVLDTWVSPSGLARYPSRWRLEVPSRRLALRMTPEVANQELSLSIRYWEGAVRVEGTYGGAPVRGAGFVELTGYDEDGNDHARR